MERGGRAQAPDYAIPQSEVTVGVRIGAGALGEVRRGTYRDTPVALKGLHMLRTDAAAQAEWGGALSPAERQPVSQCPRVYLLPVGKGHLRCPSAGPERSLLCSHGGDPAWGRPAGRL